MTQDGEVQGEARVYPFFIAGLHFGLLQAALFFVFQAFITATYVGYFAVVIAWMGGAIFAMKRKQPDSMSKALVISAAGFIAILLTTQLVAPFMVLIPLYLALCAVVALPAGVFFRDLADTVSARSLFLHENNGFVLGLALGAFAFLEWGVSFLYLGPLLSMAIALLAVTGRQWPSLFMLGALVLVTWKLDGNVAPWLLAAIALAALGTCYVRAVRRSDHAQGEDGTPRDGDFWARWESRLVLAMAGGNLVLLQLFITREFSSVLAASELTIMIVGTAYFAGLSVGYLAERWVTAGRLRWLGVAMFFIHLAVLMFGKVLAGYLIIGGYGALALVSLLFAASFCAAAFYSILLPRLISSDRSVSLVSGYTWDLGGAMVGTAVALLLAAYAPAVLWPLYFTALLALVLVLNRKRAFWPSLALGGVLVIGALIATQDDIHTLATEDYYRTRTYSNPRVVFQGNSFYHSMEAIDTHEDVERRRPLARVSFINGVRYFRYYYRDGEFAEESKLSEFSYFLAGLPARYQRERLGRRIRVLIMGAGSMYSIRRVSPHASRVTLVEIDPLVVETARVAWPTINRLSRISNYEIVYDDIKHYLQTTDERFDLIVNDISAPYYLGTALLHGRDFFELVKTRLTPDGVFAEALQGRPNPDHVQATPMKILRGVADVFPVFRTVVTERGYRAGNQGFVYAALSPGITTEGVTDAMRADNMYEGTSTFWERSARFQLHRVTPLSLRNMGSLLGGNLGRMKRRLGLTDDDDQEPMGLTNLMGRMLDTADGDHSRLAVSTLGVFKSFWFWLAALLVLGSGWWLERRARRARAG